MGAKKKLKMARAADAKAFGPGFEIHDPAKFTWTDDDLPGLIWLGDHEYTGTVNPHSPSDPTT